MRYGKYPDYATSMAIVKDKFGRYNYHPLLAILLNLYDVDGYIVKVINEWVFHNERKLINMYFKEIDNEHSNAD